MKKFLVVTIALVAVYLLFQNPGPYAAATDYLVTNFRKMWEGLTSGKVQNG